MIFLQILGFLKFQFYDSLFDNDFISSGENPLTNLFSMAHAIYMIFQLNLLFVFLYCSTTAITSRGGFTEAIFYCFTVWSLCSVLIASYIFQTYASGCHEKVVQVVKIPGHMVPLFTIHYNGVSWHSEMGDQTSNKERLLPWDPVSHVGILSVVFFSTSFIHRETHFRQVFTTAWHHGTKGFMTFIAIQKKVERTKLFFDFCTSL